jgi:hypothetical protein
LRTPVMGILDAKRPAFTIRRRIEAVGPDSTARKFPVQSQAEPLVISNRPFEIFFGRDPPIRPSLMASESLWKDTF